MNCKNCGAEIGTDIMTCPECGQIVEKDIKRICPNCNAEVNAESKFCKKCGWNFETGQAYQRTCPKCGDFVKEDVHFCSKCGYDLTEKINEKKRPAKTRVIAIVIIAFLAVGVASFSFYQWMVYEAEQKALREAERQRQELIVSYQEKAIELNDTIGKAESNFSLLSTMFDTSTQMNTDLLGPSFYTAYVEGLCSYEINQEKSRKKDVDRLYDELNNLGCDEDEVMELKDAINDYYYAYVERYQVLVEMEFTTWNFSSKDSASKSTLTSARKAVKSIIDSIEIIDE